MSFGNSLQILMALWRKEAEQTVFTFWYMKIEISTPRVMVVKNGQFDKIVFQIIRTSIVKYIKNMVQYPHFQSIFCHYLLIFYIFYLFIIFFNSKMFLVHNLWASL